MTARTPSAAAALPTARRSGYLLSAATTVLLLGGVALASPAAAVDDPTKPDARVTHGPSCHPGGVVVEVTGGTVDYEVTLATTRSIGGEDSAEIRAGGTVVLRTGDVAWGETIDGRLEYTALDGSGTTFVDELDGYTFTRPAEEDCAAIAAPAAAATVPHAEPAPDGGTAFPLRTPLPTARPRTTTARSSRRTPHRRTSRPDGTRPGGTDATGWTGDPGRRRRPRWWGRRPGWTWSRRRPHRPHCRPRRRSPPSSPRRSRSARPPPDSPGCSDTRGASGGGRRGAPERRTEDDGRRAPPRGRADARRSGGRRSPPRGDAHSCRDVAAHRAGARPDHPPGRLGAAPAARSLADRVRGAAPDRGGPRRAGDDG